VVRDLAVNISVYTGSMWIAAARRVTSNEHIHSGRCLVVITRHDVVPRDAVRKELNVLGSG